MSSSYRLLSDRRLTDLLLKAVVLMVGSEAMDMLNSMDWSKEEVEQEEIIEEVEAMMTM